MTTRSGSSRTHVSCKYGKICDEVFEIYKPKNGSISMEMVFFHGLQWEDSRSKEAWETWMAFDGSECWLETWLVEDFPQARILSVSYDSSISTSTCKGREGIYVLGEKLAQVLVKFAGVGQNCPVILVGYCVGGLVLKQTCLKACDYERENKGDPQIGPYREFLNNLKGAFFFATPQLGSEIVPVIRSHYEIVGPMVEYVEVLGSRASQMNAEFSRLCRIYDWKTYGVTESDETDLQQYLKSAQQGYPIHVVNEASARENVDQFMVIPKVDHFTICKPPSKASTSFVSLTNFLKSLNYDTEVRGLIHRDPNRSPPWLRVPDNAIRVEDRINTVVQELKLESEEPRGLVLFGMVGIGKSTLAKQVLSEIERGFDYTCFLDVPSEWGSSACETFKRLVVENLYKGSGQKVLLDEKTSLIEKFWDHLQEKNVLIIVDNVHDNVRSEGHHHEDQIIEAFPFQLGNKSRLVIISSHENVLPARHVQFATYSVPFLSREESERLLKAHLLGSVSRTIRDFKPGVVSQVVEQCDGLPLTLEVMGRYLRDKVSENVWMGASQRLRTAENLGGDASGNAVWKELKVSIDHLAEPEKKLFLDVASFDSYGPKRRQYDFNVLESAWKTRSGANSGSNSEMWLTNLQERSLWRVRTTDGYADSKHVHPITTTRKVYIQQQLGDMAKWMSRWPNADPIAKEWSSGIRPDTKPEACSSVWILKTKGETPCADIWSLDEKWADSPAPSAMPTIRPSKPSSKPSSRWLRRFICRLQKLRFLRMSNMDIKLRNGFTFPKELAMLHLDSCNLKLSWLQGQNHWLTRGKYLSCLSHVSVLILENCSLKFRPRNLHNLVNLKILYIHSKEEVVVDSLPTNLVHLSIKAPLTALPTSLLQLPSLQSMVLENLDIVKLPIGNGSAQLTALKRLRICNCGKLEELPENLGLKALVTLDINYCRSLTRLPNLLVALRHLRVRNSGNVVLQLETEQLPALTHVSLDLDSNEFSTLNDRNIRFLPEPEGQDEFEALWCEQ